MRPEAVEEEERPEAPKGAAAVEPELGFWAAARRRLAPDDPFFTAGDLERELLAKHVALDLSEDDRYQIEKMEEASVCCCEEYASVDCIIEPDVACSPAISLPIVTLKKQLTLNQSMVFCPIAGCGAQLNCLEDFEDHYITRHTASCSVCSRVYPTSRLLNIHVSEAHDSYFQAKVAHGFPMYECLVEGCGMKLKTYKSRQQHLIDKHQFPKSFEFFKKARPSQRQRQKNHRRQTAPKGEELRDTLMDVDGKDARQTNWRYRPKQHDCKESKDHKETKENETEVEQKIDRPKQHDCKESKDHKEAKENEMEVEQKIDELTSAVSKLSTADSMPASVTFGHRRSHGLTFAPRSIRQNKQASQPEAK